MMPPRLIGLTGPAGSGKDTAGSYLDLAHGYATYALAEPIRAGLRAMFNLPAHAFDAAHKESAIPWLGVSPRVLMQTLGTQWGRQLIGTDLWLRVAAQRLAACATRRAGLVVTDIRFEDEARWIRSHGGQVWHLLGRRAHGVRPHESEAGVRFGAGDISLDDSGTEDELYERVDAILQINGWFAARP